MAYDYDALYKTTPNALGAPTPDILAAFEAIGWSEGRVLDVGCGQGRDAVFIARLGYEVVGVDLSPAGIKDLLEAARAEDLAITGIVADLVSFDPEGLFDIILIDRTLHMLAETDRHAVLARLLDHVAPGGWCLIADEKRNIPGLVAVIDAHEVDWEITRQTRGYLFLRRT